MSKQKKFPNRLCVKYDGNGYLLVVGQPDNLAQLDAEEGEKIATYVLNGPLKVFHQHPRLEK